METVAITTEPVLSVCMSLHATSRTFSSVTVSRIKIEQIRRCIFARAVCGWGVSDDGDRTRENSATGEDTSFLSGRLGSGTKVECSAPILGFALGRSSGTSASMLGEMTRRRRGNMQMNVLP